MSPAPLRPGFALSAWLGGSFAVFERDFLVVSSGRRFIGLRTVIVAIPVVLLVITLLSQHHDPAHRPEVFGRAILGISIGFIPFLFALIVAPQCAACIAGERERGTLPLVLAAPVSPTGLVLAKFASHGLLMFVLFVATLPPASISFLYGGVDPGLFGQYVVLVAAWIAFAAAVGVAASAFCRRSVTAMQSALTITVALPLAHLVLGLWLFEGPRSLVVRSNVAWAWSRLLEAATSGTAGPRGVAWPSVTVLLCLAGLALILAIRRIGAEGAERGAGRRSVRPPRPLRLRNPFLARQLEGSPFRAPGVLARLRLLAYLAIPACTVWALWDEPDGFDAAEGYYVAAVPLLIWGCAQTLSGAARSISRELGAGSWPVLRVTALTTRELLEGAVLGHMLRGGIPVAISVVILGVAMVRPENPLTTLEWLTWVACGVFGLSAAALLGLMGSCQAATAAKGVSRATAWTFGGFLAHGLFLGALGLADAPTELIGFLACASPPVLVTMVQNGARSLSEMLAGGTSSSWPWSEPALVAGVIVWTLAWLIGIALLRRYVGARLERIEDD